MRPIFKPRLVNPPNGDPALFVDLLFEKRALLFDLGELKALPPRQILRISDIFVSHCHMDHFMGFDWLLRICLGRERVTRWYGPPGFVDQVAHKLAAYTWNLARGYETDFTLIAAELQPDGTGRQARFSCHDGFRPADERDFDAPDNVLLDDLLFRVRFTFLDHKIPCLAFALEEKAHINVWKNRLADIGVPVGPWLRELKLAALRGEADEFPLVIRWRDGEASRERIFVLGELKERLLRIVAGQKICYVTDCFCHDENRARIVALTRQADTLFIEAPFLDADRDVAAAKAHLTARQAGELARAAGAKSVVPFHFSARYSENYERLYEEVGRAFGGCSVASTMPSVKTDEGPGRREVKTAMRS